MAENKRLLLISKRSDARGFVGPLTNLSISVSRTESYKEAEEIAMRWLPQVIVFLVPRYWESIVDLVTKIKSTPEMEDTEILYIGKLIEGADLSALKQYDVKTMALGPVPEEEMVRFIDNLFD